MTEKDVPGLPMFTRGYIVQVFQSQEILLTLD